MKTAAGGWRGRHFHKGFSSTAPSAERRKTNPPRVALNGARMTGKRVGVDTATRMLERGDGVGSVPGRR